jgi:hypothetical protein
MMDRVIGSKIGKIQHPFVDGAADDGFEPAFMISSGESIMSTETIQDSFKDSLSSIPAHVLDSLKSGETGGGLLKPVGLSKEVQQMADANRARIEAMMKQKAPAAQGGSSTLDFFK